MTKKEKISKEIEFLKYQQESLKYGFDKYVNNYHHSVMWITTIAIGIAAILISLGRSEQIWFALVFYFAATSMRLFYLKMNSDNVRRILNVLDSVISKRYSELGLNIKELKKEIGQK